MGGEIKFLQYAEGVAATPMPNDLFLSTTAFRPFVDAAAFVSAKGTAAAQTDAFHNTTTNTIDYYDGTVWVQLGSGSGSGGSGINLTWRNDDTLAAGEVTKFGQFAYEFTAGDTQKINTAIKVPTSYTSGKQIILRIKIFSPTGSGNVLFTATSTLIRYGVDALSDTTNQRTTTNTAQSIAAADREYEILLDVTSASGQINAVSISATDTILVNLTRATDTNTDYAYIMPTTTEVTIS